MFNAKRTQSSTNWSAIPVSPVVEEQVEWYLNVRAKRTLFTQELSANPTSLGADLIEACIFDEARETRMVEPKTQASPRRPGQFQRTGTDFGALFSETTEAPLQLRGEKCEKQRARSRHTWQKLFTVQGVIGRRMPSSTRPSMPS